MNIDHRSKKQRKKKKWKIENSNVGRKMEEETKGKKQSFLNLHTV